MPLMSPIETVRMAINAPCIIEPRPWILDVTTFAPLPQEQRDDIKDWIEEQELKISCCKEIEVAADGDQVVYRLLMIHRDERDRVVWRDGRIESYTLHIFHPTRPLPWSPVDVSA